MPTQVVRKDKFRSIISTNIARKEEMGEKRAKLLLHYSYNSYSGGQILLQKGVREYFIIQIGHATN